MLGDEAPEALLATTMNDMEVTLFLKGSWQTELIHAGIFQFIPFVYGGNPLLFTQIPDVYILLAIADSLWFEAQIGTEASKNIFIASYYKEKNAKLLSIKIGNSGISLKNQAFSGLGSPSSSFGIKADVINTQNLNHAAAMLRWDTVNYETYTFYGYEEETTVALDPAQWIRGKAFALVPETRILSLYTVKQSQTTVLFPDAYHYNMQTGILLLKNPTTQELYATISLNGNVTTIQLYRPNSNNQYELKNIYSIPGDVSAQSCAVINKDTNIVDTSFSVHTQDANTVMIVRNNALDPADNNYSMPFYSENPWIYDPDSSNKASSFAIVTKILELRDSIVLPDAVIPGSLTVYRNGMETTNYIYDSTSHKLIVTPEPLPTEEIVVVCKKYSNQRNNGQLVAAAGYSAHLNEFSNLETAVSAVFSVPDNFSAIGIEKANADIVWNFEQTYLNNTTIQARSVFFGRFSLNTPFSKPVTSRWQKNNFMRLSGTEISISAPDSTSIQPESLPGDPGNAKPLFLSFDKTLSGTSCYAIFDTNIVLEGYGTIGFYIQMQSSEPAAVLTVDAGAGTNTLCIEDIPVGTFPTHEWILITVDLLRGTVQAYDEHNNNIPMPGTTIKLPEILSTINTMKFYFSSELSTILVSEPVLFSPLPRLSALQEGSLAWISEDTARLNFQEQIFLHTTDALPFMVRGSGDAFWKINIVELSCASILEYADALFNPSVTIAFGIVPESLPVSASNKFSYTTVPGRYAQAVSLALASQFPVALDGNVFFNNTVLLQTWKLTMGNPGIVLMRADLKQQYAHTVATPDIVTAYTDSWSALFSFSESEILFRVMNGNIQQQLLGFSAEAKSFYSIYETHSLQSSFTVAIAPDFRMNFGTFTPRIKKSYTIGNVEPDNSIEQALAMWAASCTTMLNTQYTWEPFYTAEYAQRIIQAIEHYPQAIFSETYGLMFQRPLGFGLWDIAIPALISLEGFSEYAKQETSVVHKLGINGTLGAKVGNLFSRYGFSPLLQTIEFDEYQWKLTGAFFCYPLHDSTLFYTIKGELNASLAGNEKYTVRATGEYSETDYGRGVFLGFSGNLSIPMQNNSTSWILDLVKKQLGPEQKEEADKKKIASLWLTKLGQTQQTSTDLWSFSMQFSQKPAHASIKFEEKYSGESALGVFLTLSFFIRIEETISWQADSFMFLLDYALGLSLKAVF